MDVTEAEDIKKKWQEYKKDLNDQMLGAGILHIE